MFPFGVDYYPEHWPEERWPEDARLMAEAGFNVVRLAEFAWSTMEPREGDFDFGWLDRAISVLSAQGMHVLLGTPTASPPPWLATRHPEIFRVREDGHRVTFGNRRGYCPNNPVYRDYTCRIVSHMADHYADHPAVVGWQIDNEFGDRCCCPVCAETFRSWLSRHHENIEELNRKWGTVFWSHRYSAWSEVPVPLATGGSPNPGLALDYYRFQSDSYVAYQQLQIDLLRQRCPRHLLLHDLMGFRFDTLNYFDLARNLDLVAWNNYPRTQWNMQSEVDATHAALAHDTMRGLKHKGFWVTEQQAGSGGWEVVSVPPRPGECRLWAYQSVAHGAEGILFFRWRTSRHGTEQYWQGLLDHDGRPSRRYEEIKRMGAEIRTIGEQIRGSTVKAPIAMILSYDSRFAFQIQINNPQFSYTTHFHQVYRALQQQHALIDVVSPLDDLHGYRLVIAPALHVVSDTTAAKLRHFVETGGVLVVTARSGVKDESNAVVNQRLPGLLAELCGAEVEEYDSLPPEARNPLEFTLPGLASSQLPDATVWCDVLQANGATVVARYTQDYYAGKPAITLNRFGEGQVVYVGTVGGDPLYQALAEWILGLADVPRLFSAPPGVELAERCKEGERFLFVLNHTEAHQTLELDRRYRDLLHASAVIEGKVGVAPRDVLILREERDERQRGLSPRAR